MTDNVHLHRLVARERAADDARAALHAREAARAGGVAWSGLGPEPFRRRTPDAYIRCAAAMRDALAAWQESRAGRLNAALTRAQALSRAVHATAAEVQAALARNPDAPCPAVRELAAHVQALAAAAEAAMDAAGLSPLSGGPCATNTASSRRSTGSPRTSPG